jgi:DNA-binding NarL/FixJ family response regulator
LRPLQEWGLLTTQRIRVLLVEDFEPFRSFVRSSLQQKPDLEVIGELSDGLAAVQKAEELYPDLILLDIGLPSLNGIEAARQIRKHLPKSKIIFMSQESSAGVVREALGLGASGYVVKKNAGSELLAAVEAVLQDKQFVSEGVKGYDPEEARDRSFPAEVPPPDAHSGSRKTEITHCHEVEFYSDEELLLERFGRFVAAALKAGKAAIVIATERHRAGLVQKLQVHGVDVPAAIEAGRYIPLSVADTLSNFMVEDKLDPIRFAKVASDLLSRAAKTVNGEYRRVTACGECAPELWAKGMAEAAIRLEQQWDEVAKTYGVNILCAYPVNSFRGDGNNKIFKRICAEHSVVYQDGNAS